MLRRSTSGGKRAEKNSPAGALELTGPGGLPGPTPETAPLLRDHAQQDWRDVVARMDVPVLMVAGHQSQYWPCAHAQAAVAGNRLGRAVVLDDCGHAANFDQPDAFNAALLEFLRDL
jgi:pimeloyl-ACP methyl ester carboxylesterase